MHGREACFEQHGGGSLICQDFGVFALVVVGGQGERHQQRRLAGGAELGDGAGAGAGEDQIGLGEACRHVIEKRADLPPGGVSTGGGEGGVGFCEGARSGLVQDLQVRDGVEQVWEDLREHVVEHACSLASAEYEQVWGGTGRPRGEMEEVCTDRDSGDAGVAEVLRCGREVDGCRRNSLADETVGEPGHGVWLKRQGGDAGEQGCCHGWAGGIAADADDYVRLEGLEQGAGFEDGAGQVEQGAGAGGEADAFELADGDELERVAGLRDKARLKTARGAEEEELRAAGTISEGVGDGECRDDVAAGAAAGDEDADGTVTRSPG
jgi:hypothetical protein